MTIVYPMKILILSSLVFSLIAWSEAPIETDLADVTTQSTDKKQWDTIKKENSKLTDELSDVYSDMVWDYSLEKITYLENQSDHHFFLLKYDGAQNDLILIRLEEGLKKEKYNLINKGAVVSDGKTFEYLKSFLSK